jgi:hypothetical protein
MLRVTVRRCFAAQSIGERERELLRVWGGGEKRPFSMDSRGKARVEKEIRDQERELLVKLRRQLRDQQRNYRKAAEQMKQFRHQLRRIIDSKKD